MEWFEKLGPVPYHREVREAFRNGDLCGKWAKHYPNLFDAFDLGPAQNQCGLGYHFFEWLAAIVLYHSTGYLSLVESYQFKKHERKQAVVRSFAPPAVLDLVIDRMIDEGPQCPDLFVYSQNAADWYFCEVKGPTDTMSLAQRDFFEELERAGGRPVRVLTFQEIG